MAELERAGTDQPADIATVALVGMMGSGKSAVGRQAAAILGCEFHDTDAMIEAAAGCTVAEIFARDGEPVFRAHERRLIERFSNLPPAVLALGGGMFVGEDNVAAIRSTTFTIWLRAAPEILLARMGEEPGGVRPLLQCDDPPARLRDLLDEREPWYGRAHAILDVGRLDVPGAADRVVALARAASHPTTGTEIDRCG